MRISSLAPLLLLGACGGEAANNAVLANVEAEAQAERSDDGRIDCAVKGAAMAHDCIVDREMADRGLILTVRNPDGGFHRLLVTRDGRGVVAADGAEPAKVKVVGQGQIEVAIGPDVYRLPATVKGQP